jgi:hypothetical protein
MTSTAEAPKAAQDAMRRYMAESTSIGRSYITVWSATAQANMRAAFDLQNATMRAWRAIFESAVKTNPAVFDQVAESVRKSQDATIKMVAAGFSLMESALPSPQV